MALPKGVYRADHVGSLLRPNAIKEARMKMVEGKMSAEELRKVEDECIVEVVKRELDVGLRCFGTT
jgi:5-methyltetrahydropteroyltriglutamate--homocysteine methyltransferase